MRIKPSVILLNALILGGCANMAPELEIPEPPVTNTVSGQVDNTDKIQQSIELKGWKAFFRDKTAKAIIEATLDNNRDLRIAAANVAELQGQYQIAERIKMPDIGINAGTNASKNSKNLVGNDRISRSYNAGVGLASYEIDFWGRVENLNQAALSQYFASLEAERATKLALIAQSANAYYQYLMATERLSLAQKTLKGRKKSEELIKMRQSVGIASSLDYAQAKAAKSAVEAQQAAAERQVSNAYAALEQLVGAPINELIKGSQRINQQRLSLTVPENLSADVLLTRPDILQAEEALRAANANMGVARAAYFPQVRLTGSAGFLSADLNQLFRGGSKTWSFAPSISLPLFGNTLDAQVDVATAQQNRSIAQYEKAVQTAFSEVYTQLNARKAIVKEIKAQQQLVSTQKKRLTLAKARYDAGISSYLDVLQAQQDLFSAEQSLIVAETTELSATVQLYKALGGGDELDKSARQQYFDAINEEATADKPSETSSAAAEETDEKTINN